MRMKGLIVPIYIYIYVCNLMTIQIILDKTRTK